MLSVNNLYVEVGGKFIVSDLTFTLAAGSKVGLVGRNGAGKTSLMKVLGGVNPPSSGKIHITGSFGYLNQDTLDAMADPSTLVVARVLSGRDLGDLADRIEKLRVNVGADPSEKNLSRYAKALDEFERRDGYRAEADAKALLSGLGLAESRFSLALGEISGGERRRVELARILFRGSEVLMLDEPTNHLDVDAKRWLLNYLKNFAGVLVVVSHDLELLDESINRVFHLERGDSDGSIIDFKGNYSTYKRAIAQRRIAIEAQAKREASELDRLTKLADSMRHQTASRARVAKSLDSRAERLRRQMVDVSTVKNASVRVNIPDPKPAPRVVVEVSGVCKSYGRFTVFEDLEFTIERGERFLVGGLNGAGKTTLLTLLAGKNQMDLGSVSISDGVSVGYFAQEHEELDFDRTPLEQMIALGVPLTDARGTLAAFGLVGDVVEQPTRTLSGGEKTKLALSLLVAARHNLLLLDEPTNNLDPESRRAISKALAGWKGTMIVVTHDVEFASQLEPNRLILMPDGTVDHFSQDYLELIELS
ncbi:MAG: ABC-F family ATP-binding cassette domain-containing protein [Actinomycetota bacterium]|nr:ABC-F family ATP-binding cassette domain-containing protein [Actinomycetota bacterium]